MNVLVNTPIPSLEGITVRHFGQCGTVPAGPYKAELERRSLREILAGLPEGFAPDLLLFRSPEYLPIPDDLQVFPGPKALMITDWNVCLRFLPDLCRLFDVCFTDEPGTRLLRRAGVHNIVSQTFFGHNPGEVKDLGVVRDLDLSFCGNLNTGLHAERNRLVFRLAHWAQSRPVHLGQAFGKEYLNILNRSKIVFNYSVRGEANMRLYEAMACGATVLVEKGNVEVPEMFREGEHYLAYDPATLETDLDRFLSDPGRLAAIGTAAVSAVAEHTQARQLKRLILRAVQGPWPQIKHGADPKANKARAKIRLLGAGYNLPEAVREVEMRREWPGLTTETLPALCLHLLETDLGADTKKEIRRRLESCLSDTAAPVHMVAWLRAHWARLEGRWEDCLRHCKQCLDRLPQVRVLPVGEDPGYGWLIPPINLGLGLNGDVNLSFRIFLLKGNHEAFADLLRNLALFASATACLQLNRIPEGMAHVVEMSSHRWREASPWPLLFAFCLLGGQGELLEESVDSWLEDDPLAAPSWERILRGLQVADRPDLIKKFLDRIRPAARHFLSADKILELEAYQGQTPT